MIPKAWSLRDGSDSCGLALADPTRTPVPTRWGEVEMGLSLRAISLQGPHGPGRDQSHVGGVEGPGSDLASPAVPTVGDDGGSSTSPMKSKIWSY